MKPLFLVLAMMIASSASYAQRTPDELAEMTRRNAERREKLAEQVSQIGQRICKVTQGTEEPVVGYSFGKPLYGAPIKKTFRITGFTEAANADRIRVRIGSIVSFENGGRTRNIDNLSGEPEYRTGMMIWESGADWQPC